MTDYRTQSWSGLDVYYTPNLNGGGLVLADDYLELFKRIKNPRQFGKIYEWCSGPGFIGYALLANQIGRSLCLADIYPPAVEAARQTARQNGIEDKVSIYHGDGLQALPEHEKFDLVVANPPHFVERNMIEYAHSNAPRIYVDPDWRLHKQFFQKIRQHLNQDGLIVLMENTAGFHVDTFHEEIKAAGLVTLGWEWSCKHGDSLWYMFIMRDDAVWRPDIALR